MQIPNPLFHYYVKNNSADEMESMLLVVVLLAEKEIAVVEMQETFNQSS